MITLTADIVRARLPELIAISADVSPWGEKEFLSDLPGKWELSFALLPDAYCILSRKFGPPHIHQLMVSPQKRGNGIGAKMLNEAVRRGAQTLKVAADNSGAIRFYQREGWKIHRGVPGYLWMAY
jgi:ribosomal protein S18 acetylase RimI-like enzyme